MKNLFANFKGNITEIIGLSVTVLSFAFMFLLLFVKVPDSNKDLVNTTLGFVLGSFAAGVAGYYFGASKTHGAVPTSVSELTQTLSETKQP